MRLRRVKNQTPQSSPPSMADGGTAGDERFVWEVLAPRLLQPTKLVVIQALLENRQPLSLSELAEMADVSIEHARYQCKSMVMAGVLEVVNAVPGETGEGEEPTYYFPEPPQGSRSSSECA